MRFHQDWGGSELGAQCPKGQDSLQRLLGDHSNGGLE